MRRFEAIAQAWAPRVLSVLRIVTALMFMLHGTAKLLAFPTSRASPDPFTLSWTAGALELVGGLLLAIGLFSRVTAFILSGEMAVAYFLAHAPQALLPIENRGELAVLFCFVFFYLWVAGPGPWSVDALRRRGR